MYQDALSKVRRAIETASEGLVEREALPELIVLRLFMEPTMEPRLTVEHQRTSHVTCRIFDDILVLGRRRGRLVGVDLRTGRTRYDVRLHL